MEAEGCGHGYDSLRRQLESSVNGVHNRDPGKPDLGVSGGKGIKGGLHEAHL
jgi:hypothetical protein